MKFLTSCLLYVILTPLMIMLISGKESIYFPAMVGVSLLLSMLQLTFVVTTLKLKLWRRLGIGIIISIVFPMLASISAVALFGKGYGFLGMLDLHLVAYLFLYVVTILFVVGLNRLSTRTD